MPGLLASIGVTAFMMWYGLRYFRGAERAFADLV
jgi:lipopolysaccharide transport system permease protein